MSPAPTITGFSPTIAPAGTAGAAVTISGTKFVTSSTTNNHVRSDRGPALFDTVTSTSIATTVPVVP